jgi:two-component system NtrC family sensor kinase
MSAIRHSLSGRIFAGFLLVMLAFAVVMGVTVYRTNIVRQQLQLINTCYLQLTLVLMELDTLEGNLLNTIAARTEGRSTSRFQRRQVRLAQQYRSHDIKRARKLTADRRLASHDAKLAQHLKTTLSTLQKTFARNDPLFNELFRDGQPIDRLRQLGEKLLAEERRSLASIRRLRKRLKTRVTAGAKIVDQNQRASVLAGAILVLLAVLVSAIISLRARRLLSPLQRLVESTKRIGSGDYSGRVDVNAQNELGLLAHEFNKMVEAVEDREQRLIDNEQWVTAGRIASHITHEVRNPLNSLSLNAELLDEMLVDLPEEAQSEALALSRAIQFEVERLNGFTEEYLQYARLPKPQLASEELNQWLEERLSFMSSELDEAGVEVSFDLDAELPEVLVDENQLWQGLLNLTRNAKEVMAEQGGGKLHLSTKRVDDAHIELSVKDSGPGMSKDVLDNLFKPFFSTKKGGTGLGLALTRQIVQGHGGVIRCESELGKGTIFTLTLPVAKTRDSLAKE